MLLIFCSALAYSVCFFLMHPSGKTVYFHPGFFDLQETKADVFLYEINLSELCREKGLTLKVTRRLDNLKDVNKIIVFEIIGYRPSVLRKYPERKLSLFLWEPPVTFSKNYNKKYHKYFSKVFTWHDSLIDKKKYFKFYYPELGCINDGAKPFSEKKLCCLIARNKNSIHPAELYSTRREAIGFFEDNAFEKFDLFGMGWELENFKSYRGTLLNKDVLKNYKFSICYENAKDISGYVTEKIFDSFKWLCVPVYLGANNITEYVPANCFIDRRDFKSNEDLLFYLENMTEEEYLKFQQNIKDFYKSPQAQKFTSENFKIAFLEALK